MVVINVKTTFLMRWPLVILGDCGWTVTVDEFLMRGQLAEHMVHLLALDMHKLTKLLLSHHIHNGVIARRFDALAQHHLGPAVSTEDIELGFEHQTAIAEQIQAMLQAVRNVHVATATPEFGIRSFGHMVVQDDEVADKTELSVHLAIEFGAI